MFFLSLERSSHIVMYTDGTFADTIWSQLLIRFWEQKVKVTLLLGVLHFTKEKKNIWDLIAWVGELILDFSSVRSLFRLISSVLSHSDQVFMLSLIRISFIGLGRMHHIMI